MSGINKVFLLGEIVADPALNEGNGKQPVLEFQIMTAEPGFKTSDGNEHQEFHQLTVAGKLMEIALKTLRKGQFVWIDGSLETKVTVDKGKIRRYMTTIRVNKFELPGRQGDFRP